MEGFQGFFKTQSGHTGTSGPSTLQLPVSPRPLTSVAPSTGSPLRTTVYTESQPDTSLVQKIASRFVPTSASPSEFSSQSHATDGISTPRSRGGNPIHQLQLFSSSTHRLERQPAYFESQNVKPHNEVKGTGKYGHSSLSIVILLWLINQREILKDLADIRSSSIKEQKHLQKTQEAVHTQVTSLEERLQALHDVIETQHQQVKSEMAYVRRFISVFGMIQLVVMATVLLWSSKSVRRMYYTWSKHLHKSFVKPAVSMLNHCKNISQILVYEFSETVLHYKELVSYSVLEVATQVFNRVTHKKTTSTV